MRKLNYCLDCQRIFTSENVCEYCNSNNIKELKRGKSVNIIGSKDKARYLKYREGKVSVIGSVPRYFLEATSKNLQDY